MDTFVFRAAVLQWRTKDDNNVTFISTGLKYVKGTINIPSNGHYHIYSHLTFDGVSTTFDKAWGGKLSIEHSIFLRRNKSPVSFKESLLALVRDLFTFSSKVIKMFIIV
jgi:hypothetical protein